VRVRLRTITKTRSLAADLGSRARPTKKKCIMKKKDRRLEGEEVDPLNVAKCKDVKTLDPETCTLQMQPAIVDSTQADCYGNWRKKSRQ